jgi:hypothetical protein
MNEPAPRHVKVPPRTGPLALARAVVTAHALAVFAQPVLAGQFLDGNAGMLKVHGGVAVLIELLGMIQIPVAVLLWRPGRGPLWPVGVSVLLFFAEGVQVGVGYERMLALHVPLGVTIVGVMLLLLVWVWRPRLGAPRTPDRPAAPASGHPARWATAAPRRDRDATTQRGGP